MNTKYIITLESNNLTEDELRTVWALTIRDYIGYMSEDIKASSDVVISYEEVTGLI